MKIKQAITQLLEERPMTVEELSQQLHLTKSKDFKQLVKTITILESEHCIELMNDGKLRLPQEEVYLEGTFRANDRGFGFVTIDEEEPDIFIPKGKTNWAMNGDTVKIEITKTANPWEDKAAEGKVVSILHRAITEIVGTIHWHKEEWSESYAMLEPQDKKLKSLPILVNGDGLHPEEGSICLANVVSYPTAEKMMEVAVVETIGHKDDPGVDILSIVLANGIDPEFQKETLEEAAQIPAELDENHLDETRRDLREEQIITIDGDETKDFDDAVHVHKNELGHYILGVHIADVAHYVKENSAIDREAQGRGTSVYLVDRVIPMLPRRLSNGICSLNPRVARYTLSCEMEIDTKGNILRYQIFKSIIKTCERMTYRHVNQILDGDKELNERYQAIVPMLKEMKELHQILEKKREERGAISFEDTEAKIKVDEEGKPTEIVLRQRGISEKMIESFMLAANETVAYHFNQHHWPFIYRVHEQPDEKKIQRFFEFITNFGLTVKGTKDHIDSKNLQKLLDEVKGSPEEAVINTMLLRSMQQAKYDTQPLGHYGLAARDYTHFTSPIRRYPDLMVHRLIHEYVLNHQHRDEYWEERLPEIASHSSVMERVAVDAEREVDAMKKAEYMMPYVGQTFTGVISSVVKFGLFVELENTIEGLVHMTTLDDYYEFFENQMVLIGKKHHRTYRIGQQVEVKLVKADPETREIDFVMVGDVAQPKEKQPHQGRSQKKTKKKRQQHTIEGKRKDKKKGTKGKSSKNKPKAKKKPFYETVVKKKKKRKRK
ncbi:ribonuclease R [Catellicoccus marimammalium]|uniref:Ribonuclease R n=1 Tax=Catellicoccus marimammalium M35/04/3 TaxID=1234409 RepID=K8ZC80_9ENTE|nr:ribonuclease R [Catellicoccus marimammalium]EKU27627.1 3'-to-5' exoribonuclease RNase R [Catellicoccus marimammalium M35/04/3]